MQVANWDEHGMASGLLVYTLLTTQDGGAMRWIVDVLASVIVTRFLSLKNEMLQEVTMTFVTVLLKRFLVMALSGFCFVSLLTGGLLIALIDLGQYLNAYQNFGFSYLGQIGLVLVFFSGFALYFLLNMKVESEEVEKVRLAQASSKSLGGSILEAIMEAVKRPQPASSSRSQ